jgi:hypothetical protein
MQLIGNTLSILWFGLIFYMMFSDLAFKEPIQRRPKKTDRLGPPE